jgi:hypothetical protein
VHLQQLQKLLLDQVPQLLLLLLHLMLAGWVCVVTVASCSATAAAAER